MLSYLQMDFYFIFRYEWFVLFTQLHFEFFSFLYKNLTTYIALEFKIKYLFSLILLQCSNMFMCITLYNSWQHQNHVYCTLIDESQGIQQSTLWCPALIGTLKLVLCFKIEYIPSITNRLAQDPLPFFAVTTFFNS